MARCESRRCCVLGGGHPPREAEPCAASEPGRCAGATSGAYRALLAAEHAAPQEIRRGSVRTMAAGLMRHDRALPGVRGFAQRVGALA
ncbi:hypothetical protein [Streptomyces sp. NEAU-174]|uniref:hypothetical protein n=1 Tax=Streptomyces sp. NEAU-174 TaxID=3458254 RepID=UPI0040442876